LLEQERRKIINYTVGERIRWHFIPARIPYFGGLWERAVKSFKTNFYKTITEVAMTFKKASTLVTQIETILNFDKRAIYVFSQWGFTWRQV